MATPLGAPAPDPRARPVPHATQELRTALAASLPHARALSVQKLVRSATLLDLRPGLLVFRQGEPIPLVMLMEGVAGFRRTTTDGQQLLVGIAKRGALVGVTSVAGVVSTVDMLSLTTGHVATWTGIAAREIARRDPEMQMDLIDQIGMFANILTEKVDGFLHQDARRRVIRVLARHRDLFFGEVPVLYRSHLPSLVGTSREMTGRVLRDLEQQGTVRRVGRRGLELLDPRPLDEAGAVVSQLRIDGATGVRGFE
jgi:CRP-like cAMP-binding protein